MADSVSGEAIDHLWLASRRTSTALIIALYPVIFILDRILQVTLSPVLPGVLLLALLIAGAPMLFMETTLRRWRLLSPRVRVARAARLARQSRTGMNGAILWFVAWLVLGL